MFDFHMHTDFSPDSSMTMVEAIETAIKKKLQIICFTDHVDYDYDGENSEFVINYTDYFQHIEGLRERYKNKIMIRTGVEFGLQPHLADRYTKDMQKSPFDFIIGSIHSVAKTDLYTGSFFNKRNQREAYEDYYRDMRSIIDNFQGYSVIGHLDVIKRYGAFDVILPFESYRDIVEDILITLIEKGKGIELNTSGIRYKLGDYHPSEDIIKLYHSLGGEIITIGSDAHSPQQIAFDFDNALEFLRKVGFKYVTTFSELKPEFHRIDGL